MQEVDLCINGIWLLDVNLGLSTDRKRIKVYQKFRESEDEENKSYEIRNRDIGGE